MITAAEAKAKSSHHRELDIAALRSAIETEISRQAERGKTQASIEWDNEYIELQKEFKSLGYSVQIRPADSGFQYSLFW